MGKVINFSNPAKLKNKIGQKRFEWFSDFLFYTDKPSIQMSPLRIFTKENALWMGYWVAPGYLRIRLDYTQEAGQSAVSFGEYWTFPAKDVEYRIKIKFLQNLEKFDLAFGNITTRPEKYDLDTTDSKEFFIRFNAGDVTVREEGNNIATGLSFTNGDEIELRFYITTKKKNKIEIWKEGAKIYEYLNAITHIRYMLPTFICKNIYSSSDASPADTVLIDYLYWAGDVR